ncbi:hypothetical protein KSD_61910 [Ktedonobacter sp. SOSP1-85]|uniref:DEAD/DEAH box helicase n=1 Tax=Ktedonobacter sp. SOSP1-85 TaxID=2778367 RepID=UPI00191657B1|nr:DEAD/DEAH box helicase [Ktedonobacter sp. SOSP1-85]GHO78420.1 hypothetical protein KSD_61910 [Ktedonobacter sp. SOSP1-85]
MLSAPSPPLALTLRPYQEECVQRVLNTYQEQPEGGKALVVLPTGCGKTVVFTEVARRLGLTTLVIAHRQELLQQAADKFRLADPTAVVGQVGTGRHEWGASTTVASIQTISRPEHLKNLSQFRYQLVVIDEGHHATSDGYKAVLAALSNAFVLAVTATPDRLDKQRIESIFGEPVFSTTILEMVEQGYLCDLRAIAVRTTTSLDGVHTQGGDFKTRELEEAVDTPERNLRIMRAYQAHAKDRQAICFAVTVEHAHHLAEAFQKAGFRAAVVSGDTPQEERKHILQAYARGELEVLCNVSVLTEGYDHPATSCIIMARPTKSRALYTQAIGRGTRLAPGKRDCVILDVTDNCLKHRLQPQLLQQALGVDMRNGESITEARHRLHTEAAEAPAPSEPGKEGNERTTKVLARTSDLLVNILAPMDWKRLSSGAYVLEVGEHRHRIALVPSALREGYYAVWAKLAPTFKPQLWLKESPLEWAQTHAEMKARLLQTDEKKRVLVDSHAPWRSYPASLKQLSTLRYYGLDFQPEITSGEASDLIGQEKARREQAKAKQRVARQAPRSRQKTS